MEYDSRHSLVGGIIVAVALVMFAFATAATAAIRCQTCRYDVQVVSVYDGDTFRINWPGLPAELNPVGIRLRGVDTPERNSKCVYERQLASAARTFTVEQLNRTAGYVRIGDLQWDKYGGRIDADVYVGPNQQSLGQLLIENGHARPYTTGRRKEWC